MENSKTSLEDMMVQLLPDQTMTGEVIEGVTENIKQELSEEKIQEDPVITIETIKEEALGLHGTDKHFNTPTGDMMVQLPPDQTMTGEAIEELPENKRELRKAKIQEGLAIKVETIKKEVLDFCATDERFNTPSFEIQENRFESESKYNKYYVKVQQNDGSDDCIADSAHKFVESLVRYKEEAIDIHYEDLETEITEQSRDSRCNTENDRMEMKKKIKLHERGESLNKPKQERNHQYKLSLVRRAELQVVLYRCHDLSKCYECSYATKHARNLKRHMLVHEAKSEVDLYKCRECSYASRHASYLKRHMLVHKPTSELDLYKCHECSYASKRPAELRRHLFVHRPKSEIGSYKCHECSYASNEAGNLKRHMLVHKAKSEVYLYKCHECSYVAKHAIYLKKHILVHKTKSEVYLHKCHECSFATKHATSLKGHMLVHKAESEVELHKCQECSYAGKRPQGLKKHMLVHKSKSEVDLYKCHECSFSTKHSYNLKSHMLIHKSESEVKLYRCHECSLATRHASYFKKHMLVHTAQSKVKLYRCHERSYAGK